MVGLTKVKGENQRKKGALGEKIREIERVIENKKDTHKNREKSEDIIKKRAERLKQSI